MNRLSLASAAPAEAPARPPSACDGASEPRCGGLARGAPRCHGGTSTCSPGVVKPTGPDRDAPSPAPLPEPLVPPGPSPVRGDPGSFGELTYGSLAQVDCFVVVSVLFGVARNGNQCVAIAQVHQAHSLGLPSGLAHLTCPGPDDTPA